MPADSTLEQQPLDPAPSPEFDVFSSALGASSASGAITASSSSTQGNPATVPSTSAESVHCHYAGHWDTCEQQGQHWVQMQRWVFVCDACRPWLLIEWDASRKAKVHCIAAVF